MDKSKLPDMDPNKVVPVPKVIPMKYKPTGKKKGGVGGVLDAVAKRNRKLKEAAGN